MRDMPEFEAGIRTIQQALRSLRYNTPRKEAIHQGLEEVIESNRRLVEKTTQAQEAIRSRTMMASEMAARSMRLQKEFWETMAYQQRELKRLVGLLVEEAEQQKTLLALDQAWTQKPAKA